MGSAHMIVTAPAVTQLFRVVCLRSSWQTCVRRLFALFASRSGCGPRKPFPPSPRSSPAIIWFVHRVSCA